MKQKYSLIIGIIVVAAILIAGFVQQEKLSSELPNIQVVYHATYGLMAGYKTLTINNDGLVALEEQQLFEVTNSIKFIQLSSGELQEFKELVDDVNVSNLNNNYGCNLLDCPTDMPSISIKFIINSKEKTIFMNAPSNAPENLEPILEKIAVYLKILIDKQV
jgi:Tfp pilus assembly protein PilO